MNDRPNAPQIASRRTFVRTLVTAGVLAAGVIVVKALETSLNATFDKPMAPLSKPFGLMKKSFGKPARFESVGADGTLDPETVNGLGTPDYLLRRYRDLTVDSDAFGAAMNANVNYYATGSATPHVPEICWAGSGRNEAPGSREFFEVKDVPRKDGSHINLRMRMISFQPGPQDLRPPGTPDSDNVYVNVAYVFHVNGEYVASPQEVTSRIWNMKYHYAYHAKIEVTPTDLRGVPMVSTREQAQRAIAEFIRFALPEVEECLPDPRILTAPGASTDTQTGK